MIQIDELKSNIRELNGKLNGICESLNIPKLQDELQALNEKQHKADFWDDVKNAQQVSQRAKNIEDKLAAYNKLCKRLADVTDLIELCDGDETMLEETSGELLQIATQVNEMHIATLLSGKFDANNAILTLHAGAGGTEGICLFLASVGIAAGKDFASTVFNVHGIIWVGYGVAITLIPLLTVGIIARSKYKMNYLSIMGILSGGYTDPPALAYANKTANNDQPAVAYSTVYPLTMFLRVIVAQIIILCFI